MASNEVKAGEKKKMKVPETAVKDHLFIAAIDFGTTYTGYAYRATSNSGDNIFVSQWGTKALLSEKAPTCVLLAPDKKFKRFGFEAEDAYKDMLENEQEDAIDHYFFARFKMELYKTKHLKRDSVLKDVQGKELLAMEVFAIVIEHLKGKFYTELKNAMTGMQEDDVLWVITVPAIWSDSAKQFMRESANKAGIEDDNLKLILEPEAASLYCNSKKVCKTAKIDGSVEVETFPVGHQYIVADLGGGTADLSVHEILDDRNLREIRRADGGAFGGIMVDQAFEKFLENVFGKKTLDYLKKFFMNEFIDLQREFEAKKRNFPSEEHIKLRIPLPDIQEAINETGEGDMSQIMNTMKEKYGDKVQLKRDKLFLRQNIMESFFKEATDGIIKFIKEMREDDELGEINTILMVGGFSGSVYIQNRIRSEIPGLRVIVPSDPVLSVLKGAVIFGQNPKAITERRAQYSYGFSVGRPFQPGDPEELKVKQNGRDFCMSVFDQMITKGENVELGYANGSIVVHSPEHDNPLAFLMGMLMPLKAEVYRSTKADPKYTTEENGCEKIGNLLIRPRRGGWPPIALLFQGMFMKASEFHPVVVNLETKDVIVGKLDFL